MYPCPELTEAELIFINALCPELLLTTNQDCVPPLVPPATNAIEPRDILIPALKVEKNPADAVIVIGFRPLIGVATESPLFGTIAIGYV